MAQKTFVTLEDDLDGGPADETVRFGLDGSDYEIDLNQKNATRFRKQIAPFVHHARAARRAVRRPVRTVASRRRSHAVRMWALGQGIELSERGRIPSGVVEEYERTVRSGSRR
jgi:Lsr2